MGDIDDLDLELAHIDEFDELYVLGFESPFTRDRSDTFDQFEIQEDLFPVIPSHVPRCMVPSCGTDESLTPCSECGFAFFCARHGSEEISNSHSSICQELTEAKDELAAWTSRFWELFGQDPDSTIFHRDFLRRGKLLDRKVHGGYLSYDLYWSPKQRRQKAQHRPAGVPCLNSLLGCPICSLIPEKTRNPHQHALDGYCKAYRNLSYKLFDLARQSQCGRLIREILRRDLHAYRQGMSGSIAPDTLNWVLAMEVPCVGLQTCWNVLATQEIHRSAARGALTFATGLSGHMCSPDGSYQLRHLDESHAFLDPVGHGCIIRDLESTKEYRIWTPRAGQLYNSQSVHPELRDVRVSNTEADLVLNFQALEDLIAVKNASVLSATFPVELVLLIQEYCWAENPVIYRSKVLSAALRQGRDLQRLISVLERIILDTYNFIDDRNTETINSKGVTYFPWIPRYIRFFKDHLKLSSNGRTAFDHVLARMPRLEAWIWKKTCEKYPSATRVLQSAEACEHLLNPRDLYFKAYEDRFGRFMQDPQEAWLWYKRVDTLDERDHRGTVTVMNAAREIFKINDSE